MNPPKKGEDHTDGEHFHLYRCLFGIGYLVVGAALFALVLCPRWESMLQIIRGAGVFHHWLFCLGACFWGFAALLLQRLHFKEQKKFPKKYVFYYPIVCVVAACFTLSLLHLLGFREGVLFYVSAFPFAFSLGFLVDRFWEIMIGKLLR